jgi:hypothetical protein
VAERALRPPVQAVADELVLAPVEAELDAHERLRKALARAQPDERPRRARLTAGATAAGAPAPPR